MPTATVTSKGQITIPAEVRASLGLHAGDRVDFVRLDDGSFNVRPATLPVGSLKGFFGAWDEPAVTLEQMDVAIADGAAST